MKDTLKSKTKYRFIALFSVASLVLMACGDDEPGDDVPDTDPVEETEDLEQDAEDTEEEAAEEEAAEGDADGEDRFGGRLVQAHQNPPLTFDMQAITGQPASITHAVFEQIVVLDAELVPQPALAESWEISDDELTWTFTLRDGVEFHNGDPLTSADVVASFDRYRALPGQRAFELDLVDNMTEVDDLTFEVILSEQFGGLLDALAAGTSGLGIMPASIAERYHDEQIDDIEDIVGTGPYKAVELTPDVRTLLERYDNYQSPPGEPSHTAGLRVPYLDEVEIIHIGDPATRVSALLAGDVDMANAIPGDDVQRVRDADGFDTLTTDLGTRIYYKLNPAKSPFDDPVLREAVRTGLDIENVMAGLGPQEFWRVNPTPRYQDPLWMWTDQSHNFPNDMDRARELVEESDYDGEEIILLAVPDRSEQFVTAVPIQQYLQDLGLNVEIEAVDGATYGDRRQDITSWDLKHAGGGSDVGLTYLDSSGMDRTGERWPQLPDGWDESLRDAVQPLDQDVRADAAERFYDLHAEHASELWLGDVFLVTGYNSNLRGVPTFDAQMQFYNIWWDDDE